MSQTRQPPPTVRSIVRDVARSYVIDRVRVLAHGHEDLFERAMRLFALVEDELMGDPSGARLRHEELRTHPLARTILTLISPRIEHIVDAAIQVMADNRRIIGALDDRVAGLESPDRPTIEELYRVTLVTEVPLDRSLDNVAAVADLAHLTHEMLIGDGFLKRTLRREAFSFVRRVVVRRDDIRRELDGLWEALATQPHRVAELARQIEQYAPQVVREIYADSVHGLPAER